MIDSTSLQPFALVYIESIFSEKSALTKDGKIAAEFKEALNRLSYSDEETEFDVNGIKYIRVPPQLLVENRVVVRMDLSNQYTATFSIRVPEGMKWWYFIPYYGRSVVIKGGYYTHKDNKAFYSRTFTGLIKSIRPNFSETESLITTLEFECYDFLLQGLQQNTSYTIPSTASEQALIKNAIIMAIYKDQFNAPNVFRELYPNIWIYKYTNMEERGRFLVSTLLAGEHQKNLKENTEKQKKKQNETRQAEKEAEDTVLSKLIDLI